MFKDKLMSSNSNVKIKGNSEIMYKKTEEVSNDKLYFKHGRCLVACSYKTAANASRTSCKPNDPLLHRQTHRVFTTHYRINPDS